MFRVKASALTSSTLDSADFQFTKLDVSGKFSDESFVTGISKKFNDVTSGSFSMVIFDPTSKKLWHMDAVTDISTAEGKIY